MEEKRTPSSLKGFLECPTLNRLSNSIDITQPRLILVHPASSRRVVYRWSYRYLYFLVSLYYCLNLFVCLAFLWHSLPRLLSSSPQCLLFPLPISILISRRMSTSGGHGAVFKSPWQLKESWAVFESPKGMACWFHRLSCLEDLAINYPMLTSVRLTFENLRCIGRIVGNQVCYAASMIFIPMGQRMYDRSKWWTWRYLDKCSIQEVKP
jgi:hypothetical protein